ncbi:MAG TPA: hypothetical protein DCS42_06900 [Nitrospiraceae bacterium]|nr:hypothetical protein [Candidatus Omnitrophota bacterium]HAS53865.1 hypothetical protein [Nitrospiraceae bacterium]
MTEQIETTLNTLKANLTRATEAMATESTTATIKAYSAAKRALDLFQAEQDQTESGERFKNLEQAASWVIKEGYRVSGKTVRNHAHSAGFPKQQKDGSYLLKEIAAYASATWDNPARPALPADGDDDHKKRYLKEQADKLTLANEITRKNYILRSEVEHRCAAAASFLKKDLGNFGPRICDDLVDLVSDYLRGQGLDMEDINLQAVIPDLQERYDKKLDAWLDRYAQSTRFGAETE